MMDSNIVRGGVMRDGSAPPQCFTTTVPPRINADTYILAAAHPSIAEAAPTKDGWFLSDFYAFNLLFKGLGRSQTWLTASDPKKIVAKYGPLLHGNPFEDRKVVLSKDIIDKEEITPVTLAKQPELIDTFLHTLAAITGEAKRNRGNVLLMVFCHGMEDGHELVLSGKRAGQKGGAKNVLSITRLRGALEPYVPVCLLTTACYSGGWTVNRDINITTMTAAAEDEVSLSWPASQSVGRVSGSVFVSSIVDALASTAEEISNSAGYNNEASADTCLTTMDQKTAAKLETKTYNEFCRSVWESCTSRFRMWREHKFTFSAQNDEWCLPWNQATSVPLASFADRWNRLETYPYTGSEEARLNLDPSPSNPTFLAEHLGNIRLASMPSQDDDTSVSISEEPHETDDQLDDRLFGQLLSSLYRQDVGEMVRLWRLTCPGDENRGYWHVERSFMTRCAETGKLTYTPSDDGSGDDDDDDEGGDYCNDLNLADMLEFRLNMAQVAEHILTELDLPRPGKKTLLFWNQFLWEIQTSDNPLFGFDGDVFALRKEKDRLWEFMSPRHFFGRLTPTLSQGPGFTRFHRYIMASVIEARLTSVNEEERVMGGILDLIDRTQKFYEDIARADAEVQSKYRKHFGRSLLR